MSEWQPIETAPKDGTGILVIDMTARLPQAGQAWWIADVWTLVSPDTGWALEEDLYRSMIWVSPTHWLPLPAPPVQS